MHWVLTLNKKRREESRVFLSFSCDKQSQCGGTGQVEPLFDKPFSYISIGDLDFLVAGARVGELLALVGVVQVPPDGRHVFRDIEASVFLCHHLQTKINLVR